MLSCVREVGYSEKHVLHYPLVGYIVPEMADPSLYRKVSGAALMASQLEALLDAAILSARKLCCCSSFTPTMRPLLALQACVASWWVRAMDENR